MSEICIGAVVLAAMIVITIVMYVEAYIMAEEDDDYEKRSI